MRRKTFDRLIVTLMIIANLPVVAVLLWALSAGVLDGLVGQ